jgi:hypothetical protein
MATRTRFDSASSLSSFICHKGMLLRVAVYLAKPITEGPTTRPAKTAIGLRNKKAHSTALDSAMVIARQIAASVALSSKRTIAPSDWTPRFAQKVARPTRTGLFASFNPMRKASV